MKREESNSKDYNIYCTAADSTDHALFCLPATELLKQIKLCSILGKYVYLSVSHIYENPETAELLIKNPDLLTSSLVAIGLRSDCRDFSDFLEIRELEGRHISRKNREITYFLNSNTDVVITWKTSNMQPQFKHAIQKALISPQSTLRKRLTAIKKTDILEFTAAVKDLPEEKTTRSYLKNLAIKYIPHRVNAFMREVNLVYYFMGAMDKNLVPHLDPRLFADLTKGYKQSMVNPYEESPIDKWLVETFRHLLLPLDCLDLLTVAQIAEFRKEYKSTIARFRNKWWSIVKSGLDKTKILNLKNDVKAMQNILNEAQKETSKVAKYDKVVKAVSVSSLFFTIAALIPNPPLAVLSFLISMGSQAASNENIKLRLLGADIYALTSSIKSFSQKKFIQH